MTAALTAEGVTCLIAGRAVVSDVSLEVRFRERVALFGPSGSGKTVLLTTLGGLIPPQAGRVWVSGVPLDEDPHRRRDVALVFQNYGLVSLLTAAENVEVALRAAGRPPHEATAIATEILDRLDVGRFADHLIEELSGGQEQRVAVARALALRPRVLLADEPTTEQDADHRELVLRHLLAVTEYGAALVMATHDEQVAARCDRVLELREGAVVHHLVVGDAP
ncbi:MAG: ABC transporter ATP-binding protein [Actinomycetota bacterium]